MMFQKKFIIILLMTPFFLFMAPGEGSQSSNEMEFIGKTLNFIILFGGLAFVLIKPIKKFLEERASNIKHRMKEAEEARKSADKKLQEGKAGLDKLAKRVEKIKKEGELQGRENKERILKDARKEAKQIQDSTSQEIKILYDVETRKLREYAADLAVSLAREKIQKKIVGKDQFFLIDKSIERLENLYEKSGSSKEVHSRVS